MSERGRAKQQTEQQQLFFKKLQADRTESAKTLDKPSMEGIKETVIEKYSEQAHFVFELLQNADDAKATKARFVVSRTGLIFAHNGTVHFSISDVDTEGSDKDEKLLGHINAITSIAQTAKSESEIGKFGIGFKSVFQYSDTPEIFDPPFFFKIERFIVPVQLPSDHKERKIDDDETLFYFPFNSPKKKLDDAYKEITTRLKDLNHPLLFLKNLKRIGWKNEEFHWNYSQEEEIKGKAKIISSIYHESSQKNITRFLVFEKEIPSPKNSQEKLKIDISFKISSKDSKNLDSTRKYSPFCFFETHEPSDLRFIIQAPFVLNNSREGLKDKDQDNEYLIQNIALLLGDSLSVIRDLGYLSLGFFEMLPLPLTKFDSVLFGKYKPFLEIILKILKSDEKLLPAYSGGYVDSRNAIIARGGKEFIELLGNEQLENLFQKKGIQWLDSGINKENDKLWFFFTDRAYLGINHIRPEEFAEKFSKQFIEKQSDDWVTKFYSFLLDTRYLSDLLKNKPYIRIQIPKADVKDREINHVEPFDSTKKPKAFLPIENQQEKQFNDFFPVVKENIVKDSRAKQFLERIGLTSPDEFAAISQVILPKYLKKPLNISDEINKGDIEKISRFIKIKRRDVKLSEKMGDLKIQMRNTPFLYATNNEGKKELRAPRSIYMSKQYFGNPNLELFFDNNQNAWFLDTMYQNISEIKQMIEFLEMLTKPKIFKEEFQDYHKYKRGFTQDYIMDGLDFFLTNQILTLQKSLYLWELLLQSQKDPYYRIEFSGKFEYANDTLFIGANVGEEIKYSTIFNLLTKYAWIPDKELTFHTPATITEFHPEFEKLSNESKFEAEILYRELKFRSDSTVLFDTFIESLPEDKRKKFEIAKNLPLEVLVKAQKEHESSIKTIDGVLQESGTQKIIDPKQEIRLFFNQPQRKEPTDIPISGTPVSTPEKRRENTMEEINQTRKNEPPIPDRISFSIVKKWDGKNPEIRTFLRHEYGGECQICSSSFNQRNGDPYYEGVYMISHTKGAWLDRSGSVLCLCPTCCAKILYGSISEVGDIVQQILEYKLKNEGGTNNFEIPIILCGRGEKLHFSEKHILDLQEILKIEK